jgi:hypothetical protein
MERQDPKLREIWLQKKIPVAYRQAKSLLVRLPYAADNRRWLKDDRRREPRWNTQYKCWETPRTWFESVVQRMLKRFGPAYVIQAFRAQQKCAPACWNAKGFECECSCMGANHGSGDPWGRWYVISETLAVNWGERQYSCRLITSHA